MIPKEKLLQEVAAFSDVHLADCDHFVCIYGSYASGHHTEVSDIDMFFAVSDVCLYDPGIFKKFVIDLHMRYDLTIDNEVPYENKLIASYKDVEHAVALQAFTKEGDRFRVPPIIKSREFLSSPEIRWRLLFNALTTPHKFVHGNKERYEDYRERAERSLLTLAQGLSLSGGESCEDLFEVLVTGKGGEEGEGYLGYKKDREDVMVYLRALIGRYCQDRP